MIQYNDSDMFISADALPEIITFHTFPDKTSCVYIDTIQFSSMKGEALKRLVFACQKVITDVENEFMRRYKN